MSPSIRNARLVFSFVFGVAACEPSAPPTNTEPAGDPDATIAATLVAGEPGTPLRGLSARHLALFERGRAIFETEFTPQAGLGPLFNAEGCASCHNGPVTGGFSGRGETHATVFQDRKCDDLAAFGGPVFQEKFTAALAGILGVPLESPPPQATMVAERSTPDVFGFGLLDAIPDATLRRLADPDDRDGDGISGRVHRTPDGRAGRFGRKAQVASLDAFNAEAFVMEQGITNPDLPVEQIPHGQPLPDGTDPLGEPELSGEALEATNAFVRFLAAPARLPLNEAGKRGERLFARVGCTGCHVPALRTGVNRVDALSQKWVAAYTDLLLHDMGPQLADICFGEAQPSEFRTEPLMGLRFSTEFLHDGRVRDLDSAIMLHGGEATRVRTRYAELSAPDREAVLAFLGSL